jgi:hypothetical protein
MKPIQEQIAEFNAAVERTEHDHDPAGYFDAHRNLLAYYRQINADRADPEPKDGERDYAELHKLAGEVIITLGGQSDLSLTTLADYDSMKYGPMLGVSNEGGATAAIRHGALASPKCTALPDCRRDPLVIGVAHDAERLGAIGEVVVGPDEYSEIRLACMDRMLTTTNVGTRANVRLYLPPPFVKIKSAPPAKAVKSAIEQLAKHFLPYWETPSGRPRAMTVLVQFDPSSRTNRSAAIFTKLVQAVAGGTFCSPKLHRLGLLIKIGSRTRRLKDAHAAIDLAVKCGVKEVCLDGPAIRGPNEPLAGLLNYFEEDELAELLPIAAGKRIRLKTKLRVDPATTARHVWTGLSTARTMGIDLGKYGLAPLTLDDQKEVVVRIQHWFKNWCAAPVCYIDYPILTEDSIYFGPALCQGIEKWLNMVKTHRVRVVLIDTAKKAEGRHLLKRNDDDGKGFLTLTEIQKLDRLGKELGIKVLWAGGISLPQAYQLGGLEVFGIYVTSAAAILQPIGKRYRRDIYLPGIRVPTPEAVAQVALLLQAGFLSRRETSEELEEAANKFIEALDQNDDAELKRCESTLHSLTVGAWNKHLSRNATS